MKKTIILVLTFLVFAPFLFSQKKYPSLLWEISGNGLKETSYLYGTMHVSEKIAFNLTDVFFEKLYSSKQVALESDPSLWLDELKDKMQEYPSNYNYYKNVYNYVPLYLKPIETKSYIEALRMNNYIADAILYRKPNQNQNFQENTYLDMFIYKSAKKLNKKFYGLEDIKKSLRLIEQSIEKADYDNNKSWVKNLLKGKSEKTALEDAYRNQDLDLIDSLYKGIYSYKFRKYILYERNNNMVLTMDSLMKKGSLFSAVGAAHLPGKKGIIEILRAQGYTVKPLHSTYTDIGKKKKENIDQLIYNHPLVLQNQFDGFSINSPTNFLNLSQKQSSYFISLDIPNGAFLSLSKYKSFEFLTKNNYKTTINSLDSLLYENIPGKILSKKYITKNKYPGIDITSKTDGDEYLNTQLYITPLEVYIFNLSGSKSYIEKYKNNIFSSLNFSAFDSQFSEYNNTLKGYKAILPNFRISSDSLSFSNITAYNATNNSYYFINSEVLDMISPETEEYELKRIPLEFIKNIKLRDINTKIYKDTIPYSESVVSINAGKKLYLKTFINGASYNLAGIVTNDETEKNNFFNSFKPDDFKSVNKTINYKNKNYSINTPFKVKDNEVSLYEENLYEAVALTHEGCCTFDDESSFNLENSQKIIISSYNSYDSDSLQKNSNNIIEDFISDYYTPDSCDIKKIQFISKGISNSQYPFWDYQFSDSISAQAYKIRLYHQNNKIYELKYIINKHKEFKNPSAEEIYNNIVFFKTEDKTVEDIVYEEETKVIEEMLEDDIDIITEYDENKEYSLENDSIIWIASDKKNQKFLNQMREISTDPKKIKNLLLTSKPETLNTEILNIAITVLETYGEENIEFYENLLSKCKNNGDAQFILLTKILTIDSSKKNLKKITKLLTKYAPIPSYKYSIESLLYTFTSTEGYEDILFPEILNLVSIQEYKEPILSFLSELNDENLLKPKHIKKMNNYLYENGQNEFKRIITKLENPDSSDFSDYYGITDNTFTDHNIITYLNLLSVLNNSNYSHLISQIRETQNVNLISILTHLNNPVSLSQKEYELLIKNTLPSKKINDSYKSKFGKNIFNPEKDLTAEYAKKIVLDKSNKNSDYSDYNYSTIKIDSLTFKKSIDLNFENNKYRIFYFDIINTPEQEDDKSNYEIDREEEEEKNEDNIEKNEIAVIVFDLTNKEKNNCIEQESYFDESDEDSPLIPIIYFSNQLSYYNVDEWLELQDDFVDYIKNKNHLRASTWFNKDDFYGY